MARKGMLAIVAFLVTTSSLTLGNLAVPAYSFLHNTAQSQINTDPEIEKQVLKGVAIVLKGVNIILMGKTSGGLDQISIGDNMIRSACNIANSKSGTNVTGGKITNDGQGGEGGSGAVSCGSAINGGIGGIGGNGGTCTTSPCNSNGGSANGGNGGSANGGNAKGEES
jgi:hypothetical protein